MSSKKSGEPQRDLEPKMSKVAINDSAHQPQGSGGRQGRSKSTSRAPTGKRGTTKSRSGQRASKQPPVRRNWSLLRLALDDVTQSDTSEPRGGSAAAVAAKSPPLSWKEPEVDVVPFVTDKELGRGIQGSVSRACFDGSKVSFAVKQVEIRQLASKATLAKDDFVRLAKEVANQRKCANESPLVLPVFAWTVEIHERSLWLLSAMPVCKGSLESFIRLDGIRTTYKPYVKLFTLQLSEAVAVLHRLRVCHADILPSNVFVFKDADGEHRVVLADFGQSVDFSDARQAAAASTGRAPSTELELQVRDLYGIAGCYLAMQYGGTGKLKTAVAMDGRLGRYDREFWEQTIESLSDPLKARKRDERCFIYSLLHSTGATAPLVPAKHIKLLPFFQGDNGAHPDWADDLLALDEDHSSVFALACKSSVPPPLIHQLHDPNGGKLRLRRQDDGDKLAGQRTAYHVDGKLRGVDEPCLYPNSVACHWTPLGQATDCPELTLYSKAAFAKHAHVGDGGTQIYADKVKLCACKEPKWADVGLRDTDSTRKYVARRCVHGVETKWETKVAKDAVHLAELVDATREEHREPWCALVNFFNDTRNYVGKDVEMAVRQQRIDWMDIDADKLQEAVRDAQSKQAKPSTSKR